jgi:hypothetical protein
MSDGISEGHAMSDAAERARSAVRQIIDFASNGRPVFPDLPDELVPQKLRDASYESGRIDRDRLQIEKARFFEKIREKDKETWSMLLYKVAKHASARDFLRELMKVSPWPDMMVAPVTLLRGDLHIDLHDVERVIADRCDRELKPSRQQEQYREAIVLIPLPGRFEHRLA